MDDFELLAPKVHRFGIEAKPLEKAPMLLPPTGQAQVPFALLAGEILGNGVERDPAKTDRFDDGARLSAPVADDGPAPGFGLLPIGSGPARRRLPAAQHKRKQGIGKRGRITEGKPLEALPIVGREVLQRDGKHSIDRTGAWNGTRDADPLRPQASCHTA